MRTYYYRSRAWLCLALSCYLSVSGVHAQTPLPERNTVHLQASGQVEVPSDWLSFVLSVTLQDKDPQALQRQLKDALDQALREARKVEVPGQVELRTGAFQLNPIYARDGKISQWQGLAELIVQGRNFERISALAGNIRSMAVARTSTGLSRELREETEARALDLALLQFRAKAQQMALGFGFGGYTLREVRVGSNAAPEGPPMPMLRMAAAAVADETPVSVEGGKSVVRIQLSGSVQLQ